MNWVILSLYFLKNHLVSRGYEYTTIMQYITSRVKSHKTSVVLNVPVWYMPTIMARTIRAPSTVTIVPAIVIITAGDFVSPKRDTIG